MNCLVLARLTPRPLCFFVTAQVVSCPTCGEPTEGVWGLAAPAGGVGASSPQSFPSLLFAERLQQGGVGVFLFSRGFGGEAPIASFFSAIPVVRGTRQQGWV